MKLDLLAETNQSIYDLEEEHKQIMEVMAKEPQPSMVEQPQPFMDTALSFLVNKKITSEITARKMSPDDIDAIGALKYIMARYGGNIPEQMRKVNLTPAQMKRQLQTLAQSNPGAQGVANQLRQLLQADNIQAAAQFINNAINDYVKAKGGQAQPAVSANQAAPKAPEQKPMVGRNNVVPAPSPAPAPNFSTSQRL